MKEDNRVSKTTVKTYWFDSEDKAYANWRNFKALGMQTTMMYDAVRDSWRVKVWETIQD